MGKSWINTAMGILMIVGDVASYIAKYFQENPVPTTVAEWITHGIFLAGGIGLIVSKQWNVTNSQDPAAATIVPSAIAAIPNPVASMVAGPMVAGPPPVVKP